MEERRLSVNRKTTSLIDEFEGFYGRDTDRKAIIDMLISDDDNGSNPGVIPIVGMGGVGKTTLAQHVYNDKAVAAEEQFKIRAWVCVSDQFDQAKVTKEIVEKVTGKACHYNDLDQLQRELKKTLNGEKFLLVLDDVWSEDYEKWRQLLTPLRCGAKGSKIIITTRSKQVASKVQTVPTHDLRELEYEDCWKLFARHACLDVNTTENRPELLDIGKKIVRKCGGLPLAAKALGGVLRWETKAEKWKHVLKSEIWEVKNANILPALAMSYIHLPSHLKRCFAYCAIFPQDYEFEKEELVALWMSESLLVQQKGNQSLEEIGDMYFDDLVSRSFFQHSSNIQGESCFVMHDLVHDLARFVFGEFCYRLEGETSWKIGERTRHLSYGITFYFSKKNTREDLQKKFQGIHHETPFLRSFILVDKQECFYNFWNLNNCVDEEVIDGLLRTQKLLRVVSLSCYKIRQLSNSIGNLKHMRQLDLSFTSIRLLPDSTTALFNLKILILRGCRELVELPADLSRLINLCQLDLEGTEKLKGMPPEMGKLKKLSKFSDFVVGENGGSSIKELGHLHHLRGQISIRGLWNVKDDRDASEAILKDKENLKVLDLSWKNYADHSRQFLSCRIYANYSRQAKEVLERLQPHIHIECIEIKGYGGAKFPKWVGDISFSKLRNILLKGCKYCICLPPLGQLASLEVLTIYGNAVLEAIGLEFYGMCKPGEHSFSSLKTLVFYDMKNWREWGSCNGAFPVLEELELSDCPELMSVPSHLPSLKRLEIADCDKVKCISVETFPNLKKLEISDCSNLESLVSSTATTSNHLFSHSLTKLNIVGSSKLEYFPRGGLHAPNLKIMIIDNCDNLKSLPQGMHSLLSSLEELELHDCPELLSVPNQLPSLKRLSISSCDELDFENLLISTSATLETIRIGWSRKVKCISVETFPNLKELHIWNCSNLESLWSAAAATATTTRRRKSDPLFSPFLTSLHIWGSSKLVSFPREGLHAPNLKSMQIEYCDNLQSLPQGMHSLLPSLESLTMHFCPKIESLPEEGLPASLSSLYIQGSPLLKMRCEREIGADWPKIKHIPRLFIR